MTLRLVDKYTDWVTERLDAAMSGAGSISGPLLRLSPAPDASEIPFTGSFIGRVDELSRLERWLGQEAGVLSARLVTVLGLGGVGKTSLVAQAARAVAGHFDRVLWRSLLNAPPLESLLTGLLQSLAQEPLVELPPTPDAQLALTGYVARPHPLGAQPCFQPRWHALVQRRQRSYGQGLGYCR